MASPSTDDAAKVPRVTMRHVAERAGVSLMTASLALRGHARISPATTNRVLQCADELGYRPDPIVSRYMSRIRAGALPTHHGTIALLEKDATRSRYVESIVSGVQQRAERFGFRVESFLLNEYAGRGKRLAGVLRARGISGAIIMPMVEPQSLAGFTDWSQLSVVVTTYSVTQPEFHRVVPHQYANFKLVLDRILQRGYQRVGLVLTGARFDVRLNRVYSAWMALHNAESATPVPPLMNEGGEAADRTAVEWVERHRPDVIITNSAPFCLRVVKQLAGRRIPQDIGLFVIGSAAGTDRLAHLEEHPDRVGAVAVNQLIELLFSGERGIPAAATVTMVPGTFVEGPTLRRKPASRVRA